MYCMGNRQQSRFLALMENYDRLVEVQSAAMNSEDAGLLQYSKTLDSLETKLTNIKTNFQQFYMEIINGPLVGGLIDIVNSLMSGLNKLGTWSGLTSLVNIIAGIKTALSLLVKAFSGTASTIYSDWKKMQEEWLAFAKKSGYERGFAEGSQYQRGLSDSQNGVSNPPVTSTNSGTTPSTNTKYTPSTGVKVGQVALSLGGAMISAIGTRVAENNQIAGQFVSGIGNAASWAATGMQIGTMVGHPIIGGIIGGIAGALASLPDFIESLSPLARAKEQLEKAQKAEEEAKLEKAEKVSEANSLETTITNLKRLQAARYQSEDAEKEYIDACNEAAETYPELVTQIDSSGNKIIDIVSKATEAEEMLATARLEAAEATEDAAFAALYTARSETNVAEEEYNKAVEAEEKSFTQAQEALLKVLSYRGVTLQNSGNMGTSEYEETVLYYDQVEAADTEEALLLLYNLIKKEDWYQDVLNDRGLGAKGSDNRDEVQETFDNLTHFSSETLSKDSVRKAKEVKETVSEREVIQSSAYLEYAIAENAQKGWTKDIDSAKTFMANQLVKDMEDWAKTSENDIFVYDKQLGRDIYTTSAAQKQAELLASYETGLDSMYRVLGYHIADFNTLISTADSQGISKAQFEEQFKKLGLNWEKEGIAQDYYNYYFGDKGIITQSKDALIKDLTSRFSDSDSFNTTLSEEIVRWNWGEVFDTIPATLYSQVSLFVEKIQKQIESGQINTQQGINFVANYLDLWKELNSLNLDSETLVAAQQALASADLLSITGRTDLKETLTELGVDVSKLSFNRLENATVNLITEWGNLETKLTSEIEALTDTLTKAASGMDLKEAYQAMNKYGLKWSEFTFADGKYYLSDSGISQMANQWQDQLIENLNDEQERVSALADKIMGSKDVLTWQRGETTLTGPGFGLTNEQVGELSNIKTTNEAATFFGHNSAEELTEDELDAWKFATTYWQDYQDWLDEQITIIGQDNEKLSVARKDSGTDITINDYLSSLGQEISEASQEVIEYYRAKNSHDAEIAIQQQKLKEKRFNKEAQEALSTEKLYAEEQRDSAMLTIAKQGRGGYTEEEIATFATVFGQEATGIADRQADGTYKLTKKFIEDVKLVEGEYGNLLTNLIATSTESALSSINNIATKIANGEKGFLSGYEEVQTEFSEEKVKDLLKNGDKDLNEVGKFINAILTSQGLDELDGEELIQASKELVASYNDSINSNVSRFFELKQKELEGTLTHTEETELADYSLNTELKDIYKTYNYEATESFITNAILLGEAALKAVQDEVMTWAEAETAIEQEIKADLLSKRYGDLGFEADDSYSTYQELLESEGIFDSDLIVSLLKMLTSEGIDVSVQDITDILEWNDVLNGYVLKDGTDIPSIVKSWGVEEGTWLYHYLTESLTSALYQKDVSIAIKKESLGKTVLDSIGAALSDITNASLSDLIDLYEEIHGENTFAESGLLDTYKDAVEQAHNGQIASLVSVLKQLAAEAQAIGANIDTSAIKDSFNALLSSLVQALSSGISGTLSNVDFDSLISLIGGNTADYSKYITQSFEGIRLSSEGALKIAGQLAKQYGNIPSIAETLKNADYWDSYKDVDNLIQDIIKNSEEWGDESDEILSVLYKIRDTYSQISSDEAFDILNFDALDGNADNYWKFAESIKSVAATLDAAFKGTSKMSYQQFYSMTNWIEQFNPGALGKTLGKTTTTLQQFFEAVEQTKKAGQVDLKAAATNLGIGFSDISGSIEGGIEDIAKEQIEYWTTYRDFLKNLKKLNENSKDLEIEMPSLESENGVASIKAFEARIDELHNLGYGDFIDSLADYFNIDWEHLSEENIINFINAWNFFISSVSGYSIEQLQSLWVKDANGKVSIDWSQILTYEEVDFSNLGTVDENALDKVLDRMGFVSNGDGTYIYKTDDFTATISVGEGGTFSLSVEDVEGQPLSNEELLTAYQTMGFLLSQKNGELTYTDPNTGLTFSIANGQIVPDWANFEKKGLGALTLQSMFGGTWNSSDDGKSYTATLGDGSEVFYNIATGTITIGEPQSAINDLSKNPIIRLLGEAGYNASFTSDGKITGTSKDGSKLTWDLTTGVIMRASDDESDYEEVSLEDLLTEVYGNSGWEGNRETGYTIKNSDGSVAYTIPVSYKTDLINTVQEVIAELGGTNQDKLEIEINADTSSAQKAIEGLDGQQITIQCKMMIPEEDGWSFFDYGNNPEEKEALSIYSKPQEGSTESSINNPKFGTYSSVGLNRGSRIITPVKKEWSADDYAEGLLYLVRLFAGEEGDYEADPLKLSKYSYEQVAEILNHFAVEQTYSADDEDGLYNGIERYWADYELNKFGEEYRKLREDSGYDSLLAMALALKNIEKLPTYILSMFEDYSGAYQSENGEGPTWQQLLSYLGLDYDESIIREDINSILYSVVTAKPFKFESDEEETTAEMLEEAKRQLMIAEAARRAEEEDEWSFSDVSGLTMDRNGVYVTPEEAKTAGEEVAQDTGNFAVEFTAIGMKVNQIQQIAEQISTTLSSVLSKMDTLNTTVYVSTGGSGTASATYKAFSADGVSALASGNATKTLVGELGPELAVYDNQYHLLGQNGAEFANLPTDAIVFNHKQTEDLLKGKSGVRGKALVNGNVSGPAYAGSSNIDAAIAQADKIIKLWSDILNTSLDDMLASSSGGGNDAKANIEELQEWYNLSRQIANVEQEINNLIAERENIAQKEGAAYLRSLRQEQNLLNQQVATQKLLLDYQALQLKRQADQINQNKIWSQFLTVDENGLLQYIEGNETNGGKGALKVLQELNEMSAADQEKFIKNLGYSYTDNDGKTYSGENLVKKFYSELQDQIDQYDSLYDTVHETEEKLEELASSIEEINTEIRDNKLELEQDIYDTLTSAWEEEISALKEQKELIEEANKAYVDGLNEALKAEKELYSQSQSIDEREKLQRQLSLLRRSGGSASQISSLEKQLDEKLKDEYFNKQEKMIQDISDANEEQSRLMEEQVELQEDALEYQKENGVLWTKVYEVMNGSYDSILAFMQGKSTEFFQKSSEQQEDMLTEWARKIGIYTEDREHENYTKTATAIWNSNQQWAEGPLQGLQSTYESLDDEQKANITNLFSSTYAEERMSGSDEQAAQVAAAEKVKAYIRDAQKESSTDSSSSTSNSSSDWDGTHYSFTYGGKQYWHRVSKESAQKAIEELYQAELKKVVRPKKGKDENVMEWFGYEETLEELKQRRAAALASITSGKHSKGYSKGGLVDYTGIAMVHGSKNKPEAFLNAEQTKQITKALQVSYGQDEPLTGLRDVVAQMRSIVGNLTTTNTSTNYDISIAPGAVVINVDELADSYDVEELSADIMNRIADIASKTTSRGVSRR